MQTEELIENIQKFQALQNLLAGIVAIDNLPKSLKLKHFIIANTDFSTGSGKHWFCILKVDKNKYEIFDSLGFSDEKKEFLLQYINFSASSNLKFKFNISQVQSNDSQSCGLFVLYFLIHRLHNFDINFHELFNEIFSDNLEKNESLVLDFKRDYLD